MTMKYCSRHTVHSLLLLLVTVSFVPVFSLQQQEGRMFSPLAYTKTFAMGSAAILAITIIPVLMYYFVRGNILPEKKNPISRFFIWLYKPFIKVVLRFPKVTVIVAIAATLGNRTISR